MASGLNIKHTIQNILVWQLEGIEWFSFSRELPSKSIPERLFQLQKPNKAVTGGVSLKTFLPEWGNKL